MINNPTIRSLTHRAEKAEERIKELEGFLDWTEEDEEWDKTWQQIMKEWKEGVYDDIRSR